MKSLKILKQQKGQGTLELVLLMTVMLIIAKSLSSYLKDKHVAERLTSGPWAVLDGMIQCGVWKPCGLKNPSSGHPSTVDRVLSVKPEG